MAIPNDNNGRLYLTTVGGLVEVLYIAHTVDEANNVMVRSETGRPLSLLTTVYPDTGSPLYLLASVDDRGVDYSHHNDQLTTDCTQE